MDRPVGPQPYRPYPPPPLPPRPEGSGAARVSFWVAALSPIVVLALVVWVVMAQQKNLPDDDAGSSTTTVSGATPGGSTTSSALDAVGGSGATPPSGVDLLQGDPTPAFEEFGTIRYGSSVPRVREIVVYNDFAVIDVEVPGQEEYVDEWTWRDGEGLTGPEAGLFMDVDAEDFASHLFELSEIDSSAIPGMVQNTLSQCTGDGFVISHVIIENDFDDQNRVLLMVYAGNPDRTGTGGYLAYLPDGTLVGNYCD